MTDEEEQNSNLDIVILGISELPPPSRFTAIVPKGAISEALMYHVIQNVGVPSCRYRGSVKLGHLENGDVEAIVEITWWPHGSPDLPFKDPEAVQ